MSSTTTAQTPQLSYGPRWLLPTQWTLTGFALLLTAGRYVLRWRSNHKLLLDDYSHGFATIMLVVGMGVTTAILPLSIALQRHTDGEGPALSDTELKRFYRLLIAMTDLFWVVLYSIKFTFLILYRRLFGVSPGFRKVWWVVLIYIFLSFWASLLTSFWVCGAPSKLLVLDACLSKDAQRAISHYAPAMVALNIAGDIAIIALPLSMLRKLHMKKGQKIGLAAVFLMASIVIFFDIARILVAGGGSVLKLAIVWDIMEPLTAVIISSLIPYSALLTRRDRHDKRSSPVVRHGFTENRLLSKVAVSTHEPYNVNLAHVPTQTTDNDNTGSHSSRDGQV